MAGLWPPASWYRHHPQLRQLLSEHGVRGSAAAFLWLTGCAYAHDWESGGFVPQHVLASLVQLPAVQAANLAQLAVSAGLMVRVDDAKKPGYRVLPLKELP